MIATRRSLSCAAMVVALALAGCGDGGGGVASTPPPPTYLRLADLSGNQTFQTAGVHLTGTQGTPPVTAATLPFGQGLVVRYDAAADSFIVSAPDGTTETFDSSTLQTPPPLSPPPSTTGLRTFTKPTATGFAVLSLLAPQVNGVALSYTMFGALMQSGAGGSRADWVGIGGVPTLAADLPRTGSASYNVSVQGWMSAPVSETIGTYSTGSFTANFGSGTIDTSLHLISGGVGAPPVDRGTFTGTGQIAAGGTGFTGTFSGVPVSGLSGAFFGPQGAEIGYAWYISDGPLNPLFAATGTVAGIKK